MSASFYNESGDMFGFDCHRYWIAAVLAPGFTAHIVTIPFTHSVDDEAKITGRVTSAGRRMFQGGISFVYVPHVPIPLGPPCPAREPLEYAMITAFSKSKAVLAANTVTGQGKALAICADGSWGANFNCNEPTALPTDKVRNFNTVVTTPSAEDFALAALDVAADYILGKIADRAFKALLKGVSKVVPARWQEAIKNKIPEPVRNVLEKLAKNQVKKPFKEGYSKIKKAIQSRLHAEVP